MTTQYPAAGTDRERSGAHAPPRYAGAREFGDITLPSGPQLPGRARATVSDWLDGRASTTLVGDAQLLISELVTNSVLYAVGEPVRLRAGARNGSFWFEVGDGGRAGPVARRAPSADGSGGYGLALVDCLASDWGVTHADGTEVWFELGRTPPESAA